MMKRAKKQDATSERDAISELVAKAAKGDRAAFGDLIEATQNRLFRFAITLCGDRNLAEDLCQEAFIKAHGNLSSLSNPNAFVDWLFQITKNLYLDLCRSKSSKMASLDDEENGIMAEAASEGGDMGDILAIRKALSQFEPEDRCLLVLVDLEERTYQEAAEILGITEDAVRTRLFRLRKAFIEKMSKF